MVRTTMTLDDDVAEALRAAAHERRQPFKQVVNETLRKALKEGQPASQQRFTMEPRSLGARPGINLNKALHLASDLEDEEIVRKLAEGR
jgi:hypothetical protein